LTHLFLSREYPPASYLPGGIGTYLCHITEALAAAGETVHVIAHRWSGAPQVREERLGGRLIVHRVALDEASDDGRQIGRALIASSCPAQAFSWQAARLAEQLIAREGVDIIEAQEWEAPLYYLQLRRALALGPTRRPPCVIHLHSPSERIFAANEWDTSVADYAPALAQEAYSIAEADALICPSRYVADEAIAQYGIDGARVTVIPYPLGDAAPMPRTDETWATGSICYIGRIELRKGVLELADAFASVADHYPHLQLDIVGRDTPFDASGGRTAGDAVRARLPQRLRQRVRFHGQCDRDGVSKIFSTAWAAVVPSRWDNLPYSCLEAMSSGLPVIATPTGGMRELVEDGVTGWMATDSTANGVGDALRRALDTRPADRAQMGQAAAAAVHRTCDTARIVARHLDLKGQLTSSPRRRAPSAAAKPSRGIAAIAVVRDHVRLVPEGHRVCAAAFAGDARLGILSGWTRCTYSQMAIAVPPQSDRPYVWSDEEDAPFVVIRREALYDALRPVNGGAVPQSLTELCDVILRAGWTAVTYPAVLAETNAPLTPSARPARYSSMAQGLQRLHTPLLRWLLACAPEDQRAFVRHGLKHPARSARWLANQAKIQWQNQHE
jgi:glycogen(starch) synthase